MPELPEVETMVRGLRPALLGRTAAAARGPRPVLAAGLFGRRAWRGAAGARRSARWGAGASGSSSTLAGHRGIIVIQPRMTGGFWLRRARSTRPHPPGVPRGEAASDGLVLRHAAAGQDRLVRATPTRPAVAFARSHGPDALEISRDELAERLARTARGIKPTLDGPEGARRDRQHLRRRGPAPRPDPSRAGRAHALSRASSAGCTGRSARS